MTRRSQKWFEEALQRGIDPKIAFLGTELIDGWAQFWAYEISEENLEKMLNFASSCPEAALHRWSIMGGPRPWIPHDSEMPYLKDDPKYSIIDFLEKQRIRHTSVLHRLRAHLITLLRKTFHIRPKRVRLNDFLDPLILKLKRQKLDKDASFICDVMSGGFIWSDERIPGLKRNETGCLKAIFRYRTNLIVQENDYRFEALWDELKKKYPEWIGFDPSRCSPREELQLQYRKIKNKPLL